MAVDRESDTKEFAKTSPLISYRYLGTFSETRGAHEAEGWLTIRRDLRGPVGLLAAPLGIALLDTAGINVDYLAVVTPTRIDLQLFEPASNVRRVHLAGRVLRQARSQYFTESRITDAENPGRLIGLGSTHWAVAGPNPGYQYVDPRPGVADSDELPPLYEAYGASEVDGHFEITDLTPELTGRQTPSLHQGPIQVILEAAAFAAATKAAGTDRLWIEHQGTSIVARGIKAPFVTSAETFGVGGGSVCVRVELRSSGSSDQLCAVTLCSFRLA